MSTYQARPHRVLKFRDDIDIDNTWLVSDTHFGHDNIVGFCHRPEDHEQLMIAEWRAHVPEDATLLHLGDLAYRSNSRFKNLTARELPPYTDARAPKPTIGRKMIIKGNHDDQRFSFYKQSGFQIVQPFMIAAAHFMGELQPITAGRDWTVQQITDLSYERNEVPFWIISLSHYPWNDEEDGGHQPENHLRIHGHIHNSGYSRDEFVPFLKGHVNLSIEQTRYRPVNLGVLLRAVLLGSYPQTTPEQLADARQRKIDNLAEKETTNVR